MEPQVRANNASAWFLYGLFDTQWDSGFSGYRLRYIYGPLLEMARELGYGGESLLDVVERVKVIEGAVREIEGLRAAADEQERKRNEKRGATDKPVIGRG